MDDKEREHLLERINQAEKATSKWWAKYNDSERSRATLTEAARWVVAAWSSGPESDLQMAIDSLARFVLADGPVVPHLGDEVVVVLRGQVNGLSSSQNEPEDVENVMVYVPREWMGHEIHGWGMGNQVCVRPSEIMGTLNERKEAASV